MRVVYLDQRQWIELARLASRPQDFQSLQALPERLIAEADAGRIVCPLSFANIYETHKINIRERRNNLALLQSRLSGGRVLRGRRQRLEMEIGLFVDSVFGHSGRPLDERWFLSDIFFESVADRTEIGVEASDRFVQHIRSQPAEALFQYLTETPEDVRLDAVKRFSNGSDDLRARIEERRRQHADESLAMRRRIYGAILVIDNIEFILKAAQKAGASWASVSDIGSGSLRRLVSEVPTYHVERELAVRLEAQSRPIEENDFRDMQAFCASVPYCDLVVGENNFVNMAKQAGFSQRYGTRLATQLSELANVLREWELA